MIKKVIEKAKEKVEKMTTTEKVVVVGTVSAVTLVGVWAYQRKQGKQGKKKKGFLQL